MKLKSLGLLVAAALIGSVALAMSAHDVWWDGFVLGGGLALAYSAGWWDR